MVMGERFVSCGLDEIIVGQPLPVNIYLYINFRFITYKMAGDALDRATYDRFELGKMKTIFVREEDREVFRAWSEKGFQEIEQSGEGPGMTETLRDAREDAHRKTLDIFMSSHPDKMIEQTLSSSKKLVDEVMKYPYAVQSLAQLQTYSKGTVDHSVNVSVLSVYLAMQMGYTHGLILQHVGMGSLLHDLGKTQVQIDDGDRPEVVEEKMRIHPELGLKLLESQQKVPNEVKMIVAQHHENFDGTGYPKKLRGNQIYDLTRIVAIANVFDELVADGQGTLAERQRTAVKLLDEVHYRRFDPQKLDKVLKILKLGV
jgi:putative nucleotidyltransferase with HDIG domain